MNVLASIRIALRALRINKLRSSLTMLGIIIGVAAVITMIAVGSGAQERIEAQIPLGRFGRADEMAAHSLYLLSPACAYVNGECLVVDGGLSLGRGMWEPGERREGARS